MTDISIDPRAPSDAELITAVRAGRDDAFASLYERHVPAARAAARAIARNTTEADDLVAEAFTKVLSALRRGGGPDVAFRPYLLTAVRNSFYDKTRRDKRVEVTDEVPEQPFLNLGGAAASSEDKELIATAFATLPERWQLVLWHTEVEGRSPAEVAPLLGLAPNAVAALAYRAREGLRQAYLQAHLQLEPPDACKEVVDKLGMYVRDGASARDRRKVDEHLKDCASCRAVVMELQDVDQGMRRILIPFIVGVTPAAYLGWLGTSAAIGGAAVAGAGAGAGAASAGVAASGAGAGAAGAGAGAAGAAGAGAAGTAGASAAAAAAAGTGAAGAAGAGAGLAGAGALAGATGASAAAAASAAAGAGAVITGAGVAATGVIGSVVATISGLSVAGNVAVAAVSLAVVAGGAAAVVTVVSRPDDSNSAAVEVTTTVPAGPSPSIVITLPGSPTTTAPGEPTSTSVDPSPSTTAPDAPSTTAPDAPTTTALTDTTLPGVLPTTPPSSTPPTTPPPTPPPTATPTSADLSLRLGLGPLVGGANGSLFPTIVNGGPGTPSSITLLVNLPPGVPFRGIQGGGWSCRTSPTGSSTLVSCTDSSSLGAGQASSPVLTFGVPAAVSGSRLQISAIVLPNLGMADPVPSNNTATVVGPIT